MKTRDGLSDVLRSGQLHVIRLREKFSSAVCVERHSEHTYMSMEQNSEGDEKHVRDN
jgi:hypothetical protein